MDRQNYLKKETEELIFVEQEKPVRAKWIIKNIQG